MKTGPLLALLDRLDVRAGDLVFLHTSFTRMGHLGLSAEEFLLALLEHLGPDGTLAMPSYVWNLDRNARPWKGYANYFRIRPTLDIRTAPANIGYVPELFRTLPGTRRSADYWWPVCARGRLAEELTQGQELIRHPFGPGSTFELLHRHGAKLLGLGVTLNTSSLSLLPDYALGDDHPHQVFTEVPLPGLVVLEDGDEVETNSYWLLPEAVRLIKPGALIEASERLRAEVRRADQGNTIQFCYPYAVYHEEAIRLAREAIAAGRPVPWLRDYPMRICPRVVSGTGGRVEAGQFVSANQGRWARLLQELVAVPSCFEQEHAIVGRVAAHVESLGVPVVRVPHDPARLRTLTAAQPPISEVPGRFSLVARVPGTGAGRSLVLNTHLDVVPAGDLADWKHGPFSGHIDQETNTLYGRGAMDDKAGVVISLVVLEALVRSGTRLPGDLLFHWVLEDEVTGNGTLLCLDAGHVADAAVIIDGTRKDKGIAGHAGQLQFDVELRGRPASVSVSHMGVNAAEMMARLLLELRDAVFALNEQRSAPWTLFPSPFQFVTQALTSEGAQLMVPEHARARCHVTFPPPDTLASMRALLVAKAEDFARRHSLPAVPMLAWRGFAAEPVQGDTSELEGTLQSAARRCGLPPIEFGPSTGTSDMRHFVAAGIPCLLYGPGTGFNPHRANENYHLPDLETMTLFYLDAVRSWCAAPRAYLRRAA